MQKCLLFFPPLVLIHLHYKNMDFYLHFFYEVMGLKSPIKDQKNSYWLWHKRNTKTNLVSTSFINILPVSNIRFHGLSLVDIQIANASGFDAKLTIRTLCAKFASRKHKIAGYFQDWTEILWQYRPFFLTYCYTAKRCHILVVWLFQLNKS